jgi:hypothetical protein
MAEKTPFSAKIPQWSLEDVMPIADALAELAGPSTANRIAQHLGVSPTGGAFRSKIATARYYGLTEKRGDTYVLTSRGEAVLERDGDDATAARREAVLSTTFGTMLRKFAGREPNETTLAARLEDDFGVPAGSAPYLAGVLVKTATEASLVSNGRFDVEAIESVPEAPEAANGDGAARAPGAKNGHSAAAPATARPQAQQPKPKKTEVAAAAGSTPEKQSPFGGVKVVVNVDASRWTPEQVGELLRSLRADPPATGEEPS